LIMVASRAKRRKMLPGDSLITTAAHIAHERVWARIRWGTAAG